MGCKAKLNCINGANKDKSKIGFCGENVVDCLSLKGFRFANTQIPTTQRGFYTHFFLQVVTCSVSNGMEIIDSARESIDMFWATHILLASSIWFRYDYRVAGNFHGSLISRIADFLCFAETFLRELTWISDYPR